MKVIYKLTNPEVYWLTRIASMEGEGFQISYDEYRKVKALRNLFDGELIQDKGQRGFMTLCVTKHGEKALKQNTI